MTGHKNSKLTEDKRAKAKTAKLAARETVLIFFISIIVFFLEMLQMHTNAIFFLRFLSVNFATVYQALMYDDQHTPGWEESSKEEKEVNEKQCCQIAKNMQKLCHQTCNVSAHMFSFTSFRRLLLLIIFIFLNIPQAGRQIDITALLKRESQWPKILMEKSSW